MYDKISIELILTASINYAMQQNYVPVVRKLTVKNTSAEELQELNLRITSEPEFIKPYEKPIGTLASGQLVDLSPVQLILNSDYMLSLTERMLGSIGVTVYAGEEPIFHQDQSIELLAYDQWTGSSVMPELLAAFVLPNHPSITNIMIQAGEILNQWSNNPSFTGYQSNNPTVVKHQMAAIYAAIQKNNIAYTVPPASYESVGQRIRLCDAVLEQHLGSCLDLSLLYAGALEAAGLNPVLVLMQGHAFAGCWLEAQNFSETIQDDISGIKKRIADGIEELCLVECTAMTVGKNTSFDDAEKLAVRNLEDAEEFQMLIDIARSRSGGIRPIPMRVLENGVYRCANYDKKTGAEITDRPEEVERSFISPEDVTEPLTRQKMWERKLLDMSLRNMLLSFRVTQNSLQLMAVNLNNLEDALANGTDFRIMPRPEDWTNTLRDSKFFALENADSAMGEFAQSEFKNKRIRSFLEETELETVMKNLSRRAKVSLEENGTNTLYLALGFLKWYESDISEKERYAPLVLIPVDIVRKLQERAFAIRIREEEPQINITLLEYLRQDFQINIPGLDPLPMDENGLNLKLIFNTVRQAVMGKKRWDVEEHAFLGLFSFSQFIMWNDIRNRSEELKKNKVVASLLSGKLEWQPEEVGITPGRLDEDLAPADNAVPLSADSSQMIAICSAAKGQSFVLHGPPGTGKSQTITNMIANALYQGKSVLFVAEKMAALRVVQNRLAKIGLGPFCLEIHSNKARKKDVLDQLDQTLEIGHVKEPEEYRLTAEKIAALRAELNGIMKELHTRRNYGFSLYEAIAMYENNSKNGNRGLLKIEAEMIRQMQPTQYELWKEILHKYRAAILECGGVVKNPLEEMCSRTYSVAMKNELQAEIMQYQGRIAAWKKAYAPLRAFFDFPTAPARADLDRLVAVCEVLNTMNFIPAALVGYRGLELLQDRVTFCCASGRERDRLEQELLKSFDNQVFRYDYRNAALQWKQAKGEWFLAKATKTGKLIKELKLYAKQPEMITKDTIEGYYETLIQFSEQDKNAKSADETIRAPFGMLWSERPNWDLLENTYFACIKLQKYATGAGTEAAIHSACADLNAFRTQQGIHVTEWLHTAEGCRQSEQLLWNKYQVYLDELFQTPDWFGRLEQKTEQWLASMDNLKAWCVMLSDQDEAVANGLGAIVNAVKSGRLTPERMLPAFDCALGLAAASETIETTPALQMFHGAQFDEKIERFREQDEKFRSLTINEIVAKLSAKIPASSGNVANSSEIGILQRAIKSGGRMMPVRKLFDSIPTLLRMLCPCMLMSPISVAQYIDPKFPKFDLVIFDEASQLPTCEAVGAIARGENVIVVGDPKQLPPTTFFASNRVDEDNFEKEDLESVLDDCLALTMPQEHLLWHYRSRHESLIAYSNMQYYENKLYTFPSPNDLVSEVIYVPVEGVYDRSKTKQNPAEGKAIVEEIVRRLKDPDLQKESIGVVTFSSVQQNLIEDMLEEAFRKEPELELFNQKSYEPLFVKNLENVQGDERDVILFSVGYGPDKNGKVTMNFGPLNRDGGWRRLNVAISRARKRMMIFSTLKPEQIDAGKTMSDGVMGLKGFLEFAARGKNVLVARSGMEKQRNTGVEEAIAEAIRGLGYEVKNSIGCSEYKIDIGIVDPEDPERYLLAILCDGNSLGTEMMARDRNILQPDVLKSLGWNLYRLWILDWLDAPERELNKIKEALNLAIQKKREQEAREVARELEELNGIPVQGIGAAKEETVNSGKPQAYSHEMFEKEQPAAPQANAEDYMNLPAKHCFPAEEFYLPKNRELIGRQLGNIIEREGPVCYQRLVHKELTFWGIARSGVKVEQMLAGIIREIKPQVTKSNNTYFYWKAGQNPKTYRTYRKPTEDPDTKRTMDQIPAEEIANAIIDVLTAQIALSREDLIRETAKLFGFTRMGAVIEAAMENGIEEAVARGQLVIGEKITLR